MDNMYLLLVPFLIGFFPVMFLWVKNINEVSCKKIGIYLFVYFFVFIILFFLIQFIDSSILFINTVILFLLFIFYRWQRFNKVSQRILLGGQLVAVILSYNSQLLSVFLFSYFLLLIILLFSYFVFLVHIIKFYYQSYKNKKLINNEVNKKLNFKLQNPVNIYCIIPDTYANNKVLKKFFSYDNKEFIEQLENLGFIVTENLHSNYISTEHSISSMLNMDYIDSFMALDKELPPVLYNKLHYHLKNNHFVNKIQELGYKYYHFVNYWESNFSNISDCADKIIKYNDGIEFETILFRKTILSKLISKLNLLIIRNSHLFCLNKLISSIKFEGPKFIYAHLICPHAPFCFDVNGDIPINLKNRFYAHDYCDSVEEFSQLYIEQIKYLNKRLFEIITEIRIKDDNSIIIIQSDHGSDYTWITNNEKRNDISYSEALFERFNSFRAIYAPKGFNHNFGSNVNLFRSVLNYITNENISFFDNHYFFYTSDDSFKFYKVDDRLVDIINKGINCD